MKYIDNKATDVKIAYIGGGSRGWAWGLMSDLALNEDMSGTVHLYDIDFKAAKDNEIIGNKYNNVEGTKSEWTYKAVENIEDALTGADFVVISILPGTFDEMESDVHAPEEYGIYQPVGDSTGPGGLIRAMRTVPMFEYIAEQIKKYSPKAWVINYTNPMTLCVKTLYRVFPEIKAFGCCHEVFGTQKLLCQMLDEMLGIKNVERHEIKVNPVAVNHFTWLTKATYKNIDLFPYYSEFCDKHLNNEIKIDMPTDGNWMNHHFSSSELVKMDLFKKFGYIAAAGDRHLVEFCPGKWYLESPEAVTKMHFALTTVAWRKSELAERLEKSKKLLSGDEKVELKPTGEEGVNQMRALLGLSDLVTNVNIPNCGQISNLPMGAVVETNAYFTSDSVTPVVAGEIPESIYPLVSRICAQQEMTDIAISERNVEKLFTVFANDPLVTCNRDEARELFNKMCENTKEYLKEYNL